MRKKLTFAEVLEYESVTHWFLSFPFPLPDFVLTIIGYRIARRAKRKHERYKAFASKVKLGGEAFDVAMDMLQDRASVDELVILAESLLKQCEGQLDMPEYFEAKKVLSKFQKS
jgi:hypothetical protein